MNVKRVVYLHDLDEQSDVLQIRLRINEELQYNNKYFVG